MLKPRLEILAAAVLWSTSGAAIKLCSLTGWQISFGRSFVAALTLFLLVPGARKWPDRRTAVVALCYAATVVLYAVANKLTTATNAIFLQDTAPLYVLLLSPLVLKEKPTRGELLAAPLFLVGLVLFFLDELSPGQFAGNLVALASGVGFAALILGLRFLGPSNQGALGWGNLIAAGISLPLALRGDVPSGQDLGIVLYLGVIQLALPYLLFARGAAQVKATEASLLILLEPVLNPVWTFLLAGEVPGKWALVGGSIILVATAWRVLAPALTRTPARAA